MWWENNLLNGKKITVFFFFIADPFRYFLIIKLFALRTLTAKNYK